jgi:hypothetical protein
METPQFINGFTSWIETYYQLATMMQSHLDNNWQNSEVITPVKLTQDLHGSAQLAHLAKEWTDKFEQMHEGEPWEEIEWFETLEEFFAEMNAPSR